MRVWAPTLVTLLALGILGLVARPVPIERGRRMDVPRLPRPPLGESRLANGLRVVTWTDTASPTVAVAIGFPTGSARDPRDQRGLAHLVEHLMYRHAYPGGMTHDQILYRVAGYSNAFTNYDGTIYCTQATRNQLELLFWLEAHRLSGPSITEADLETERSIVVEEYLLATEQVGGQWWPEVSSKLFGDHRYGSDPHGDPSELYAVQVADILEHCRSAHVARGAVLAVSGGVEHSAVVELAERYFGALPEGAPLEPLARPVIDAGRAEVSANVSEPTAAIFFPTVPADHVDGPGLDVLSRLLSEQLYESSLREHSEVLTSPPAFEHWGLEAGGVFAIQATVRADADPDRAFDELWKAWSETMRRPTQEAAERALRSLLVWRLTSLEGDWTRAYALASTWIDHDGWKVYEPSALGPERLHRLTQQYLHRPAAAELWVNPRDPDAMARRLTHAIESVRAKVDRGERPPAPRERRSMRTDIAPHPPVDEEILELTPPRIVERTLPNGLELVLLHNPAALGTSFNVVFSRGAAADPKGHPGTVWLACYGSLLALQEQSDLSARWASQTTNEEVWFHAPFLPDERSAAMENLSSLLRSDSPPAAHLERARQWIQTSLLSTAQDPASIANSAFWASVMGDHRRTTYGGLGIDVAKISNDLAGEWWHRVVHPEGTVIYAIGPDDPDGLADDLAAALGDWQGRSNPSSPPPSVGRPRPPGVYGVDRPWEQVQVRVGYPAPTATPSERAAVFRFLGNLESGLGHGLGRLLRTQSGYTYGVSAWIEARGGLPFLWIETATRVENVGAVLALIRNQLSTLRNEERYGDSSIPPLWVNGAISSAVASPRQYVDWLHRARRGEVHRNPVEHYREIGAVTSTELHRSSQELSRPDQLRVVLVGPLAEIEATLRHTDFGSIIRLEP